MIAVERVATTPRPMAGWLHRSAQSSVGHMPLLSLLLSAVITFGVYGRVLGFSFFFDDTMDLAVTEQAGYIDLLLHPSPGSVYYRPVPYMIWKMLYGLTGEYNPVLLHLLPLLAHMFSGWLLFLILRRLTGSLWSLVPMLLFLLFPFSYQALEILGTLVHTLVTVQLLAVTLLWYEGRTRRSRPHLIAACVLSVTALWTHEYAAVVVPLLVGIEALLWRTNQTRNPSRWLAIPVVAEAIYLARYLTIDRPNREATTVSDTIHNGGFWLQGFAYPVTRQTNWLTDLLGGDPLRVVLPLAVLGIVAALALYWRAGHRALPLGTLLLGGAVFLPAITTLTYEYMQNGPRLLYIVSPASAAFWGLLPSLRWRDPRWTTAWRAGMLALLGIVVIQSVLFIERRMQMLEYGTELSEQIIALGDRHEGEAVLILNAPQWFAPKTQEFPRGHLGIQLQPGYAGYDRLIYIGSGRHVAAESRSLAPEVNGWLYNFDPHGAFIGHPELDERLRSGVPTYIVDLYEDRMALRQIGTVTPAQPEPGDRLATFGDSLWLVDASVTREGDLLTVRTRWYVTAPVPGDAHPIYRLLDTNGNVIYTHERYALSDMAAPRLWQPGDVVQDELVLDLRRVDAGATTSVLLAIIDTETGTPLPVAADADVQDGAWLPIR